ncbi:MAG: hypothetical protein V1916_00895, partial [Patescibacteria group bacterium]
PDTNGLRFLQDDCQYQRLTESATTTPEMCNSLSTDMSKKLCNTYLATLLNREDLCYTEACRGTVAVQKNDLPLCNTISDQNIKNWCIGRVTKSVSTCGLIVGAPVDWWQAECLSYVGLATKDVTICDGISVVTEYKSVCTAVLKNRPEDCSGDSFCLTQVAMIKGDALICNQIDAGNSSVSMGYAEKQTCFALVKRDTFQCDAMDSTVFKYAKHDCRKQVNLLNASGVRDVRGNFLD